MSKKLTYQLRIILTDELATAQANQTSWDLQDKTEQDVKASIGEKVNFIKHIKNTSCFDTNDVTIFKVEKGLYIHQSYGPISGFEYNGCVDETYTQALAEDLYPYTLTVTRNGQTTVTKDTFKIEQGMDTLKWYY